MLLPCLPLMGRRGDKQKMVGSFYYFSPHPLTSFPFPIPHLLTLYRSLVYDLLILKLICSEVSLIISLNYRLL